MEPIPPRRRTRIADTFALKAGLNGFRMRDVVVTGLGMVTCLGHSLEEVTGKVRGLESGIRVYGPLVEAKSPVTVAAPIAGFDLEEEDPEDWTYPEELRFRLDVLRGLPPQGVYAHYAMRRAMEDAGLAKEDLQNPRTGLFTASAGSPSRLYGHLHRMKRVGPQRCSPLGIVASIAGTLTFNLVAQYGIQGSSTGFVSACASSGHALGNAWDEIALGRQDRMLVVGAEDFNLDTILPFVSMRVLSPNADPAKASRPFDKGRDGFVATGGSVVMVLEAAETAKARGAQPYARLAGWGQGTDGYHVAISHPEGAGLRRAMEAALEVAKVAPEAIDYINAHATSTPIGDKAELRALKDVFGTEGKRPMVSSTKGLTGHGLSLSSILEAAICCLCLKEDFVPGSANVEALDEEAAGVNILRETVAAKPDYILSNSSGFGGANTSLIFQRMEVARG